jgi:hypothetical protein
MMIAAKQAAARSRLSWEHGDIRVEANHPFAAVGRRRQLPVIAWPELGGSSPSSSAKRGKFQANHFA